MASAKKDKKEDVPLVAELSVISPLGEEIVRTFDKAWHRALEVPTPVNLSFRAFVRKDKK